MMDRRIFLGLSAATLAACGTPASTQKKRIAITMDDFNLPEDKGKALERDAAIRAALPVQAAGFVSGRYESRSAFDTVLANWAEDGHILANHTYSHHNSSLDETAAILADIDRNHARLSNVPGFQQYFRFPFLADGKDRAQQTAYYDALRARDYQHAPVTIDSLDWYVDERMKSGLENGVAPEGYRDYWIGSVLKMANYMDQVAGILGVPDLPHQLLVHHLDLDGRYLGDLVAAMQADGWTFVPAKVALDHPFYTDTPPEPTHGRSLLNVQARAKGVETPPYPDELRGFGGETMDALGL
jgi:peptidoglycan/xylan/chitin deacetylase (PgdA/CDA1 family)